MSTIELNFALKLSLICIFIGIFASKYDLCRHWRLPYSKFIVYIFE